MPYLILVVHVYFRCPVCPAKTTESLILVSPDVKHDHHAVQHFTTVAMEHLRQKRGLTIDHFIQWTDGCAAQYKSKGPFADISNALSDLDSTLERNFFGSRHGKGPSDGEAAVVKKHTMTAIKAGAAVVSSAEDMYSYLIGSVLNKQPPEEGCTHSLRTFLWIPDGAIQRDRPGRKLETVKGTRSFHTVRCVQQGAIMTRHLACACDACLTGVGSCLNRDLVGPWTCHALSQPGRHQQPHQAIPAAKRPHVH